MALMKMEHDFLVWNSLLGKKGPPFRSSLGPGSPVWKKWLKTGRSKTALKRAELFSLHSQTAARLASLSPSPTVEPVVTGYFRCCVAPGNFPAGTTQKVVFRLLSNRIFRKLFANGKQPLQFCALIFPVLR